MNIDIPWFDDYGDVLESEGIHPGHIFEFQGNLRGRDLLDGGLVIANEDLPVGQAPDLAKGQVRLIIVKMKQGDVLRLSNGNPLCISRYSDLLAPPHLC